MELNSATNDYNINLVINNQKEKIMEKLKSNSTALIVIDVQNFYWEKESHDEYIENLQKIIEATRNKGLHVVYVKHVWGDSPDDDIFNIRQEIKPQANEAIVIKRTPGSFFNTNLEEILKSKDIKNVIITGMKTNHCCDTTTREASARGYNTMIISEGVRTFDLKGIDGEIIPRETIQYVTLSILQGFAKCISTQEFLHLEFE